MGLKTETLKPEIYQALEAIVGPEYINSDPAMLDGYCFNYGLEKFTQRPSVAISPASTEEVQAIVRVCNRYKVRFRAYSTGFGIATLDPVVAVDLRRMDRILEIDQKNMYAVVEPYCSFAAVMNAAMKKGLRVYQIGAGPSCSLLANATSMGGYGTVNVSAGYGGRVPLGVEWVLPDGELLRLGSLGVNGAWFSGDGPGISLRGAMRGIIGAAGGNGIFTKLAVRLAPWYGPTVIESYGDPPNYKAIVPECIRSVTMVFPSRKNFLKAMQTFQEEGIAYWCSRRGPFTMVAAATGTNAEVLEQWEKGDFQKKLEIYTNNVSLGMDASSSREMAFREKLVKNIVDELDGEILEETPNEVTARFVHGFNGLGAVKGTFRSTGGMASAPFCEDTWDLVNLLEGMAVKVKNKYGEAGMLLHDGDSTWVTPLEDFGAHMETPIRFDPADPESRHGALEYLTKADELLIDNSIAIPGSEGGTTSLGSSTSLEGLGPKICNIHKWIKKIRKALDPNQVGDRTFYPTVYDE